MHPLVTEFASLFADAPEAEEWLFAPPATAQEIDAFQQKLGLSLPPLFYDLYRWHNGSHQEDYWYRPFFDGQHLLSLEGILGSKEAFDVNETNGSFDTWEPGAWWDLGWVPLLEIDSWYVVVIDTVGSYGGEPGQIIAFDYKSASDRSIMYPSLEAWMRCMIAFRKQGWIDVPEDKYEPIEPNWDEREKISEELNPGFPQNVALWRYRRKEGPENPHFQEIRAAIEADDLATVKALVEGGKIRPDEQNLYEESKPNPLSLALQEGRWEIGKYLLSAGADPHTADVYGQNAFSAFCDGVGKLQHEPDPAIPTIDYVLLEQLRQFDELIDWDGLVERGLYISDLTLLEYCAACGFDFCGSPRWHEDKNFLHYAIDRAANEEVVVWLIQQGIDLLKRDSDGKSPKEMYREQYEFLIAMGAGEPVKAVLALFDEVEAAQHQAKGEE